MKKIGESRQIKRNLVCSRHKWGKRSRPYRIFQDLIRWMFFQDTMHSSWLLQSYEFSEINLEKNTVRMNYQKENRSGWSEHDINKTKEKLLSDIDFTVGQLKSVLRAFIKTAIGQKSGIVYYKNNSIEYRDLLLFCSPFGQGEKLQLSAYLFFICQIDKELCQKIKPCFQYIAEIEELYKKFTEHIRTNVTFQDVNAALVFLKTLRKYYQCFIENVEKICKIFNDFFERERI